MKEQDKNTNLKKCQNCNKDFTSYPSDNKKYCCRKCFETRRKPSICLECKNEFYIPGQPKQKYCSKDCYFKNIKGNFELGHKYNLGKTHSVESISKMSLTHRLNRSKWVKDWLQGPNFNPKGCIEILKFGEKYGYEFQTAINGGEFFIDGLGYWVDGYDFNQNVVIEYMEPFHKTPKHLSKDKIRKEKIIEHLKCKYIEIWE